MTYSPTRLRVAALAAGGAVVLRVAAISLEPAGSEGTTHQMVAAAAAHPTASYVSIWSEMLCWQLAALACLTLTGLVPRGRGHRLAVAGGWLNAVSMLYLGFGLIFAFADVDLARQHPDARTEQALHAITSSPAIVPVFAILTLGLVFPIVQGFGLVRAGLVGWWYLGLTVLQAVAFFALDGEHSTLLNVVGLVPLAAILGTWAVLLHRAADAASVPVAVPAEPVLA